MHAEPVVVQYDEAAVAARGPAWVPALLPLLAGSTGYQVRDSTFPWMSLVIVTRFPSESWTWLRKPDASYPNVSGASPLPGVKLTRRPPLTAS